MGRIIELCIQMHLMFDKTVACARLSKVVSNAFRSITIIRRAKRCFPATFQSVL
jgi:hypothetical protein